MGSLTSLLTHSLALDRFPLSLKQQTRKRELLTYTFAADKRERERESEI
jgi:hypothetical protein